jgi:hypothetical protein
MIVTQQFNINKKLLVGMVTMLASLFLSIQSGAQTYTANTGLRNFSLSTSWIGGTVPGAGANIIVPAGCTLTIDVSTPQLNDVTVNGTLLTVNSATSNLNYSGNLLVAGALTNNGGINLAVTNKTFTLSGTGSYIHNPKNNTLLDESIFFGNESFSSTSSLTIQKWFDLNIPLGNNGSLGAPSTEWRVQSSNFGNVTLSLADTIPWEQNGMFMTTAPAKRVMGTLTVTSGIVSMDNNGGGPDLWLSDVMINGTGNIIFCTGPNRPLILITGNFTDVSTSSRPTIIMDNCFGFTQWTVNGSVNIAHNFYGIRGTGTESGGTLNVNITGSLNISGGDVRFISQATAPLTLTVAANTSISGSPSAVRFIEANSGALNFTTNNFIITGGSSNILYGGNPFLPPATGLARFTVNNDMSIGGVSTTTLVDARISTQKLRLYVGHDFNLTSPNANITLAKNSGALTMYVVNNINHSGGKLIGQIDTSNTGIDSLYIGGSFMMNSPTMSDYFRFTYGDGNTIVRAGGGFTVANTAVNNPGFGFTAIYGGRGNLAFTVLGNAGFNINGGRFTGIYGFRSNVSTGSASYSVTFAFNMTSGFFRGIDSRMLVNSGIITFTAGNIYYAGGNYSGYYAVNGSNGIATFSTTGILQVTFNTAATDTFMFVGYTSLSNINNSMRLNVTVGGNMNITGANGCFISSLANARETLTVTGQVNLSGGKNSFDSYPNSNLPNSHPVQITIGSDLSVNGGSTYLSANNDSVTVTIGGNMSVTLGELIVQGGNTPGIMNVAGGYSQSGGNFYLHKNAADASYSRVTVTINSNDDANGDFSHTGGTITFDNNTSSFENHLYVKSPNVTYGGTGSITMANPGTNTIIGILYYAKTGGVNFSRTSTTHNIQQIQQNIVTGCTLNVVSGNMQIASLNVATTDMLYINTGSVLNLVGQQVLSNNLQANSGIKNFGRIRTTRTQGFYDGTVNAAISSLGNMVYMLFANSVVEYYGSDNQIVTGIGVGTAITPLQKYYNLDINFTGTANTEFVYPTNIPNNKSVFVRNRLTLTAGELNLDNDHDPTSGGRSIIIERDSISAITKIGGYIRSESYDSTGSVIWRVNSRSGPHTIPFGYNSINIPFTFELPSGSVSADTIIVSTYHTTIPNLPYPPGVTHVNGLTGTDNSSATVDRFWYLEVTGAAPTASLTFVVTPGELGSIIQPRAQRWINGVGGWEFPYQGTQSNPVTGTYVASASSFPLNWWTLSGLSSPLPISLLEFTGECVKPDVLLKWTTGTEINNAGFTILRSVDGITYEEAGYVNGNGNSVVPLSYSYTDFNSTSSLSYYKIRQTDYNGKSTEYGPIVVNGCEAVHAFDVTVIPAEPSRTDIVVNITETGTYKFSLYSLDGKPILVVNKTFSQTGMNLVNLNHGSLGAAVYILRVEGNNQAVTKKIPLGLLK